MPALRRGDNGLAGEGAHRRAADHDVESLAEALEDGLLNVGHPVPLANLLEARLGALSRPAKQRSAKQRKERQ